MQELEKILEEMREASVFAKNYDGSVAECVTIGAAERILRKHTKNDGWIPVEEALPDEEAEEYIKKKLHGIGYLYPCLATYRSPMTERIHVVRFYYDIYEHWFVNAGEEVCEKERCIAWRPLPEPYHPERSENHDGE